ncbi:MAG TPA: hypothetical protein VFP79_07150 [Pseudolabrys sp.]|nr:hypothetical protein [Pseudolabrys sp.]
MAVATTIAAMITASNPRHKLIFHLGCRFLCSANSAANFRDNNKITAVNRFRAAHAMKNTLTSNDAFAPADTKGQSSAPAQPTIRAAPTKRKKLLPNQIPNAMTSEITKVVTALLRCGF